MPMRMSSLFVRTLKEDPADAEVKSHKLLHRAAYIRRAAPGIYTWLPLGLAVLGKIEEIVRQEMTRAGSQEVHFPALLPAEPYEKSGRWAAFGEGIFRLQDRKKADYLLAPTHEEMFTLLVKDLYSSYKDLPANLFQIQTKYRDEARPRAGLLRGREFIMKDAYSFDVEDAGLDVQYEKMREAYVRVFTRLGLPYVMVEATPGAMGGSGTHEFLYPSEVGEDTYVRTAAGYAANVEAVTTVVPEPIPFEGLPAAHVEDTPDTPTIQTLVDAANAAHPRADRAWSAADTLKNVVATVIHPDGTREVIVIGLPGDREVDFGRAAGTGLLGEGEVDLEAATPEDLAKHPGLVKGYIGPGLSLDAPVLGTEGSTGLRYLLDPRVVDGTRWITGANAANQHVFDLVAGRDFAADGFIEAAEVRPGDPAPDGSGELELARGVEIGQIFKLGRKYAEALDLKVLDVNGKTQVVTMGSYGIGVTRVMACIAEEYADDKGLLWPQHLAPADVHIVATGKDSSVFETAESLAADLEARGVSVLIDDRPKTSPGMKFGDAELLGIPTILVVGRGLKDGLVELRDRFTGESRELPVAEAVDALAAHVAAGYAKATLAD
ncbi:proline--tRNA ligase [Brevibacterium sp. 50QC2O2]|uniref:proline--tRNA ligase n=1 Tax=unclassified Brevibacterium TaxID=2614124 RepID=UPI00211B9826|nr:MULTISPECIES: proline--tRNA ligase [unclassified Brevibacterium]MCQ9367747.1 proline--tRNA ligase [Brevibacterium sp. 91QC2O2]MCQ9388006.1 proline--tRNA ligase [Brevibacterium sp. 50QC2O2]